LETAPNRDHNHDEIRADLNHKMPASFQLVMLYIRTEGKSILLLITWHYTETEGARTSIQCWFFFSKNDNSFKL